MLFKNITCKIIYFTSSLSYVGTCENSSFRKYISSKTWHSFCVSDRTRVIAYMSLYGHD